MDDTGPPATRRPTVRSRQSSTNPQRAPRGRRSTQSLPSSPPDQPPTLTSFGPFSSPSHAKNDSPDSCSSSKRSRSIYAPDRQNSIGRADSRQVSVRRDAALPSPPAPKLATSKAAQSLIMNTMMDLDHKEDSMFTEHDLQYFRQHPSALAKIDNATLREMGKSRSLLDIIRTLAGDLAHRDAEAVSLRKRNEELSKIFKDHLCMEHDLSRLDADRTLHSLTAYSRTSADYSLDRSLVDAADDELIDEHHNLFGDSAVLDPEPVQPQKTTPRPVQKEADRAENVPSTGIKGMLSVFGGRGTIKTIKNAAKRHDTPLSSQVGSSKSSFAHRRKSSVSSATSNLIPAIPGPVEMNAIVETENLPPPLITQRDIQAQYPGFAADVYGFLIDAARVHRFLDENGLASPTGGQMGADSGADTPLTSASSVKSLRHEHDSEPESPTTETEGSSWASYLKFDPSALGSLAWLPIASAAGPYSDESDSVLDYPAEMGRGEAVKALQLSMAEDYARLQKSRTIPWERFLGQDRTQVDGASSYVPAMFRRNESKAIKQDQPLTVAPPLTAPTPALRSERTRLVLNGVPMALRAQIYTSIALETLQPEPDEYKNLVTASMTAVDPGLLSEVDDDIPRTLPNNVFFRPNIASSPTSQSVPGVVAHKMGRPASKSLSAKAAPAATSKGRSALRELLLAFLTRRPEIGYCQGMNLIAGYLLLCLPTTESAFWVFTYLIEYPLSDIYFDATLRGASIEICVLRSYIDELIPRLGRKLEDTGVEGRESAPYNWFLTAFASALSVEGVYRVWDVLLGLPKSNNGSGGSGFLIRLGVGMCKAFEEEMLLLEGGFEVQGFMDGMGVGGVATSREQRQRPRKKSAAASSAASIMTSGGGGGKRKGISIDGLIRASWKLGSVIKDDEVRRRRKHFALKIDETALG